MKLTNLLVRRLNAPTHNLTSRLLMLLTALCLNCHAANTPAADEPLDITVAIYSVILPYIKPYTKQGSCLDYKAMGEIQDVAIAELALMCRAFDAAGFAVNATWQLNPLQERIIRNLDIGKAVIGGSTIWKQEATDHVYVSDDLLKPGEFIKGIYAPLQSHAALQKTINTQGFAGLTAVTDKTWLYDVKALDCLKSKRFYGVSYPTMLKMINAGRADFTLMHFTPAADNARTINGITLYPLPGYKVAFDDSLNYFVSRSHPDGERVFSALQKGLAILRKQGVIEKTYKTAGFLNDDLDERLDVGCNRPDS